MTQPASATRRTPRGDSRLTATTISPASARKNTCLRMNTSRRLVDALGDRRAGGQHHDVAEADQQRRSRARVQRSTVHHQRPSREVSARDNAGIRRPSARQCRGRGRGTGRRAASKPVNWSQLAQAGDSSTTSAAPARAASQAAATAASQRADVAMRHAVGGERGGQDRRVAADQQRLRRCAGRTAPASRCRRPWPCRRRSRRRGRSRPARGRRSRRWWPCCR